MEKVDLTKSLGSIIVTVEHVNNHKEYYRFPNVVLRKGKAMLSKLIAGQYNEQVYIANMLFGDGGFEDNKKKLVHEENTSLYGITRVVKPVLAQIDPINETQSIFTTVMSLKEGNGYTFNEMALQLNTGELFSMATFSNLGKTEEVQFTFNWRISFV